MMNGIDISHWQGGLNLDAVPCDFMIAKATEGVNYVDPTCDKFVQAAIRKGIKWGFYHFIDQSDIIAQADFFVDNCKNYFGHGIAVVDYEMYGLEQGAANLERFIDRVHEKTGVWVMVYVSQSVTHEQDFSSICKKCALWLAQYGSNNPTGYQSEPWHKAPNYWGAISMHQYTSHGQLDGYSGNLDLDIFYGDATAWDKIARGSNEAPAPAPAPKPAPATDGVTALARLVIRGDFGNGDARKANIYRAVQGRVNAICGRKGGSSAYDDVARDVIAGRYGNGEARKAALYRAVQSRVNELV